MTKAEKAKHRRGLIKFKAYLSSIGITKEKYVLFNSDGITIALFKVGGGITETHAIKSDKDEFYGPIGEKIALQRMYDRLNRFPSLIEKVEKITVEEAKIILPKIILLPKRAN